MRNLGRAHPCRISKGVERAPREARALRAGPGWARCAPRAPSALVHGTALCTFPSATLPSLPGSRSGGSGLCGQTCLRLVSASCLHETSGAWPSLPREPGVSVPVSGSGKEVGERPREAQEGAHVHVFRFQGSNVMEEQDLREIGISDPQHRRKLLQAARSLPKVTTDGPAALASARALSLTPPGPRVGKELGSRACRSPQGVCPAAWGTGRQHRDLFTFFPSPEAPESQRRLGTVEDPV